MLLDYRLSSTQLVTYIGISCVVVWSFLLLANAPLISPFAWIGIPLYWLTRPSCWYLGNFIGISGMFLIGGLLRQWNDQKLSTKEAFEKSSFLKKGKRTIVSNSKDDSSDKKESPPRPSFVFNNTPEKESSSSIGNSNAFLRFQSQRDRSPLVSLQSNHNYNVKHAQDYLTSQLSSPKVVTPRMDWNYQKYQEYYPSIIQEKPVRKESGSYKSTEADVVLKDLKIEEDIYEYRANMQNWLDNLLKKTHKLIANDINSQDQNIKQRAEFYLNSFINRFNQSSKEYVMHRLKVLGESGCRSREWIWNKGGDWNGKPWTSELPSDSELAIHLFCTELDSKLSPNNIRVFTSTYFVEGRFDPKPSRPVELAIYFRKAPKGPNFDIIHKNEVKKVSEGRNNLLEALVIFVYIVKQNMTGCLNQIYLDNRDIKLLSVIAK